MTVQTTLEVPQLLGVPVEIPLVQFLDKFDTPVVCNDRCRGRCLGSSSSWPNFDTPVLPVFFDKVVDVSVVLWNWEFRRCSSSTDNTSP